MAEHEGRILGFFATQVHRRDLPSDVGSIAVATVGPNARRRGIGKTLHHAAMVRRRETGMSCVQLAGDGGTILARGTDQRPGCGSFHPCEWMGLF